MCSVPGPDRLEQGPSSPTAHTHSLRSRSVWPQAGPRHRRLPLGYLSISGRPDIYALRVAGNVIEVKHHRPAAYKSSIASRNPIRKWTKKSRKGLVRFLAACVLPKSWDLITLTYPGVFPLDGRRVHRDLEAFLDRVQRQFGKLALVWKLEFQRRGAPHWMIFLQRPAGVSIGERHSWVDHAWASVLGEQQYVRATWMEWVGDPVRYVLKYLRKDSKEYQDVVPPDYHHVGRWWGTRYLRPEWEMLRITPDLFFRTRRLLARWRRASDRSHGRHRRFRVGSSTHGLWILATKDGTNVVRPLLRAILASAEGTTLQRGAEFRRTSR